MPHPLRVEPLVLAAVSGWEFTALTTGRLPTVTALVRPLPWLIRACLVAAAGVWLATHFGVVPVSAPAPARLLHPPTAR